MIMLRIISTLFFILALANLSLPVSSAKPARIKLYGEIDELSYVCSGAGIKLQGKNLPAKIGKISPGSAAAYSGAREGDKVLNAQVTDNTVVLTIDRKGKIYQAEIATNVKGLKTQFERRKIPFTFGDSPFDEQLKTLSECHIVILLDRSLSMADSHAGVPGDISKWMWCKQQIDNLFLATDRVLDNGFDLVLFNNTYQTRNRVTLWDLRSIFDHIQPEGTRKNISAPLQEVFHEYFRISKKDSKPWVILVLTDGIENAGQPLQEVLIEESKKLNKPKEVIVTFLQVGESIIAEELFDDLDHNLVAKGARHHLVNYKPFSEVRNKGILWELLNSVSESLQAKAKAQ
jgi:hypothetical protein